MPDGGLSIKYHGENTTTLKDEEKSYGFHIKVSDVKYF